MALLIQKGADLNAVDGLYETPLMKAVSFGFEGGRSGESFVYNNRNSNPHSIYPITVVQQLLSTGKVNVNASDNEGRSALAKALRRQSLELASLLIGANAGKT